MPEKPDYVVRFERPPRTEFKCIRGGWYLYEVETRPDPVTGKLLGKVTEEGFVPSQARERKRDQTEEQFSRTAVLLGEEGMDALRQARAAGVSILSCMGAGDRMDPTAFQVSDISKATMCPLARAIRQELRRRGICSLKVVYSREEVRTPGKDGKTGRQPLPGSNAFVPAVAGLIAAGEVVRDLTGV